MKKILLCACFVALCLAVTETHALVIPSLFNTGVNASGTVLPDGTLGDPHYTIFSEPGGASSTIRVRSSAGGFPIGPWLGDTTLSRWIGPNNDAALQGPPGNYDYRTTFNLGGFFPSTASITGSWGVDDTGGSILLNGVSTGNSNGSGFGVLTAFSIPVGSNFIPGLNTLDFIVNNGGGGNNPTGLRVQMIGNAVATPEPSTILLLVGGLGGLWFGYRRTKQSGR